MIKFFLKNEKGIEFRLDSPQDVCLTNTDGLGFSFSNNFSDRDNQFYLIKQKKNQTKFSPSILFFDSENKSCTQKYYDFSKYISNSNELYLYQDFDVKIDNQIPYCKCTIENVSKISPEGNMLEVSFTLYMNTFWLIDKNYISETFSVGGACHDNARYDIDTFFYNGIRTLSILNIGQNKVPLIIEIIGATTYPEVIVTDSNGNISKVKINKTTDSTQKVIIDATPFNEKVVIRNSNGNETNVYQYLYFSHEYSSFLYAPVGTSEIRLNGGNEFSKLKVSYSPQALSV